MGLMTKKSNRLAAIAYCTFFVLCITACRDVTKGSQWSWERAEAGLPRQAIILAVAADRAHSDHLWAGSYSPDGLAVSRDGGQTWQTDTVGADDNPVFDLLAMPDSAGGKVWAATRDGLFFRSDDARGWEMAPGRLPRESAFAVATAADGRLYVGFDGSGKIGRAHV